MVQSLIKPLVLVALNLPLSLGIHASTVTDPVGVVQVTIAGAPSGTKLTAISATLREAVEYQGTATSIGTFVPAVGDPSDPDGPPAYVPPSQTLNTGVTTWTANQWTAVPHLCYIENASGAEEAYLITSNGSDGVLTLSTRFDITSRYGATPTYRICKAQTLGGVFANTSEPFNSSDLVYIWNGTTWNTYQFAGGFWMLTTNFGVNANDTVVFPDEGIFVQRSQPSDIIVTINGSVPTRNQVSTIAGPGLSFVSTRFPVGTTLANSGINDANWTSSDLLYLWNGTSWDTYQFAGFWMLTTNFGVDVGATTTINPDTAMFISRAAGVSEANGALTHPIPYTVTP